MRKSERPKQKKRPFSPSDLSGTSYTKETNKEDHLNKQDTKKAPAFDLDPYGKKFECWMCGSNYIINPVKKKKKRSIKPSPRYLKQDGGDTVLLCNACGLREKRPQKRRHNSSSSERSNWIDMERKKYLKECQEFTSMLFGQLNDRDTEKLFCPYFTTRQCGCVQNYIVGQDPDSRTEDQQSRAHNLLELVKASRQLACLRHWEKNEETATAQTSSKTTKRGIGNGQKKSLAFLDYILKQREYLRNELKFCEKGCQKILGYSNNLLYRKLKTEDNQSRIKVTNGDRDKLCAVDELVRETCCTNNCTAIVRKYPGVLQEWRYRASVNKTECRRVIAEMVTPYADLYQNCNKFIRLVTGSSLVTIGKVRRQILNTGGEREPPEHGLKKYWEVKQSQQSVSHFTVGDALAISETETTGKPKSEVDSDKGKNTSQIRVDSKNTGKVTLNVDADNFDAQSVNNMNRNGGNLQKSKNAVETKAEIGATAVLPNLLVKRSLLIQEQKALIQKQGMLKSKQDLVEKDLIKILQHQGSIRKRTRKRSGQRVMGSGSNVFVHDDTLVKRSKGQSGTADLAGNSVSLLQGHPKDSVIINNPSLNRLPSADTLLKKRSENNINTPAQHWQRGIAFERQNPIETIAGSASNENLKDGLPIGFHGFVTQGAGVSCDTSGVNVMQRVVTDPKDLGKTGNIDIPVDNVLQVNKYDVGGDDIRVSESAPASLVFVNESLEASDTAMDINVVNPVSCVQSKHNVESKPISLIVPRDARDKHNVPSSLSSADVTFKSSGLTQVKDMSTSFSVNNCNLPNIIENGKNTKISSVLMNPSGMMQVKGVVNSLTGINGNIVDSSRNGKTTGIGSDWFNSNTRKLEVSSQWTADQNRKRVNGQNGEQAGKNSSVSVNAAQTLFFNQSFVSDAVSTCDEYSGIANTGHNALSKPLVSSGAAACVTGQVACVNLLSSDSGTMGSNKYSILLQNVQSKPQDLYGMNTSASSRKLEPLSLSNSITGSRILTCQTIQNPQSNPPALTGMTRTVTGGQVEPGDHSVDAPGIPQTTRNLSENPTDSRSQNSEEYLRHCQVYSDPVTSAEASSKSHNNTQVILGSSWPKSMPSVQPVTVLGSVGTSTTSAETKEYVLLQVAKIGTETMPSG